MKERNCENCIHHTADGCSSWDCEFEAKDLISRADAIEEIYKGVWNVHELIDRFKALPSAELTLQKNYMQQSRHDDGRMTREEAITTLKEMHDSFDEIHENTNFEIGYEQMTALGMAIEALSQPIVAKHFDIQSGYIYCSPQIAENVKVVVRCKDCRHADECHKSVQYTRNEPRTVTIGYSPIEWCSRGERKKP